MKILNYDEVYQLVSMQEVIERIDDFYKANDEQNDINEPDRMFVHDGENTVILKPAFYNQYYGTKLVGIAPGNVKINEPTLKGMYMLNDRKTMEPLGLFDAQSITALRTGAISGVSIKYLTSTEASTLGIIGTGVQGWSHLQAACAVRPIKTVYVYNRSKERLRSFIQKAQRYYSDLIVKEASLEDLMKKSDIIVTTTTSESPVLLDDKTIPMNGKHICGAGAFKPDMQEIPNNIWRNADRVFVDTFNAFEESKDMIQAKNEGKDENVVKTLGDLVKMRNEAYIPGELTIFKSVGQSIYDILTAELLYEKVLSESE